jgi:thiamine biosynthesis lipoprotein
MYRTAFKHLTGRLGSIARSRMISCITFFFWRYLLPARWLSLSLLSVCLLSSCTPNKQQYDYSIFTFGTLIDVTIYSVDKQLADTAFEQLQSMFDEFHQNWSPWTDGDLAQLNKQISTANESTAIELPEHLIPIIRTSIILSEQSDNFFNPAIGQLINLWQFHNYQDDDIRPPENKVIQQLVNANPQMSDISFDLQGRLHSKNTTVLLNFGAFAKGYAIKLAIDHLKKMGIKNAVINAGGDLSVIGQHGDRAWIIGIRHPRKDHILASIEVSDDESVFTSGDYERFFFYQNKRYHHILDPRTGYPTDGAQSVTVVHHDAGIADAAATALFVAGSKNWQNVAKNMGIDLVMLVDNNGNIYLTSAMQKRIKFRDKSPTLHIIVDEEL